MYHNNNMTLIMVSRVCMCMCMCMCVAVCVYVWCQPQARSPRRVSSLGESGRVTFTKHLRIVFTNTLFAGIQLSCVGQALYVNSVHPGVYHTAATRPFLLALPRGSQLSHYVEKPHSHTHTRTQLRTTVDVEVAFFLDVLETVFVGDWKELAF